MIRVISFLCIALWCLSPIVAHAADGVECELSVYQIDFSKDSARVPLFSDTTTLVKGIRANGFLAAFSVELEFQRIDTGGVDFTAQVVTLGPTAKNYSRQVHGLFGLPASIEHISGKNGAQYTLTITPIRPVAVDTSSCGWIHYRKDDFKFDPSANVDIYYVTQTAGDFYWNAVKGLMEDRYRQFADINKFTLPGKYLLYLCPCPIYSVIWDKRFGMMVDPTKLTCYSVYTTSYNTADPFLLMYASAARHYGYAPAFLLEGFAGYLSPATFDMKQILAEKKQLPLLSLLTTHTYFTSDPHVADRTAASFVRYLIDAYKFDKFLKAYQEADDLTLAATLEKVYGKGIPQLEQEWLKYIDTSSVRPEMLATYADQAEVMFNYPQMLQYRSAQLAKATTQKEAAQAVPELVRGNFFLGKYDEALKWERQLVTTDTTNAVNWMAMAGYEMMLGQYDSALVHLQIAQKKDTTHNPAIRFNLALNYLYRGDSATARQRLQGLVDSSSQGSGVVEGQLMLANLLQRSDNKKDRDSAKAIYRAVGTMISQVGKTVSPSPAIYLWGGVAALGLGDTGNANNLLTSAVYYETRAFYEAMTTLWLGKTADIRGERDVAKDYYRRVLALPAAAYHQAEAKALLQKPYTQ